VRTWIEEASCGEHDFGTLGWYRQPSLSKPTPRRFDSPVACR
jgi:hypothetical protein